MIGGSSVQDLNTLVLTVNPAVAPRRHHYNHDDTVGGFNGPYSSQDSHGWDSESSECLF